jgi:hypothetical protein
MSYATTVALNFVEPPAGRNGRNAEPRRDPQRTIGSAAIQNVHHEVDGPHWLRIAAKAFHGVIAGSNPYRRRPIPVLMALRMPAVDFAGAVHPKTQNARYFRDWHLAVDVPHVWDARPDGFAGSLQSLSLIRSVPGPKPDRLIDRAPAEHPFPHAGVQSTAPQCRIPFRVSPLHLGQVWAPGWLIESGRKPSNAEL